MTAYVEKSIVDLTETFTTIVIHCREMEVKLKVHEQRWM